MFSEAQREKLYAVYASLIFRYKNFIILIRTSTEGSLLFFVRLLPINIQVHIKENLCPKATLDYQAAPIQMVVNSKWQIYRLNSSKKEPEMIDWLEHNIQAGDVFYDIGANVGAYSLVGHSISKGSAKVYAIEPGFSTYSELCGNIILNRASNSITALPIALSSKTTLNSICYSDLRAGAARHTWTQKIAPPSCQLSKQTILCFSLDDLIQTYELEMPTLIKIDVDGLEHEVLIGAKVSLSRSNVRSLFIEIQDPEAAIIVPLIESYGLKVDQIHRRKKTFCNYVFKR